VTAKYPYEVLLANRGNPDHRQDPDRKLPGTPSDLWMPTVDYLDASKQCRAYIENNDLGGGNWTGGALRDRITKEAVGSISYNGKVWPPGKDAWKGAPLWAPT
jgi:hypothetical protein